MIFNTKTVNGIKIIDALTTEPKSLHVLSMDTGIPNAYISQLANKLRAGGLIESKKGPSGGFYLKSNGEGITYYCVAKVMESEPRAHCTTIEKKNVKNNYLSKKENLNNCEKKILRTIEEIRNILMKTEVKNEEN